MLYPDKYKEELEYSTLGRTIHYDPTVLQVIEGKVIGCVTVCLYQVRQSAKKLAYYCGFRLPSVVCLVLKWLMLSVKEALRPVKRENIFFGKND